MADLIVVLDGTRVVEVGGHEELAARGGLYAELYGIQARVPAVAARLASPAPARDTGPMPNLHVREPAAARQSA